MSYKINTTNGDLLVDLVDGKIDVDTTDLTLVGRNYTGYGEAFNENFVKLLENFANTSQPSNPIRGQVWYDTSEGRLKVYDGEVFRSTDTTTYSGTEPTLLEGDIWIDSRNKQMYFSDGVQKFLVGPNYTNVQGMTGTDAVTLIDRFGAAKHVARLSVNGRPVAYISREDFEAANIDENIQYLEGADFTFSRIIKQGFNLNTEVTTFNWHGTAEKANSLVDPNNDVFQPADFLQVTPSIASDTPQITNHLLHVRSDRGLIVGDSSDFKLFVDSTDSVALRSQRNNQNFKIQITQSDNPVDAITVDNANTRIGFWNSTPTDDITIGSTAERKSLRITGDLIVEGETTSLDVATLRVEDKNIELAISDDSSLLSDADVNGGGVILRASGYEKSLLWDMTTNSWTSNVNFDLFPGFVYKIGGSEVLSIDTLAPSVTTATGLVEIGTLQYLNVDNFTLNGNTIAVSSSLIMNLNGDLQIDVQPTNPSTQIKGVSDPTDTYDGANKKYVDEREEFQDIFMSLDITGLSNSQIAAVINDLVPGNTKRVGVSCRVHCTQYTGTVTYNGADGLSKSFVAVDKNGVENQQVLADIGFANVQESLSFSVVRSLKRFEVDNTQSWVWAEDLVSSV